MMQRMACNEVKLYDDLQAFYGNQRADSPVKKWLEDMMAVLLENMFAGERIPKEKVPQYYIQRLGVHNLYHYTHPGAYRSVYTILNEGKGSYCLVIDLLNHHDYNKRFGYD